MFVFCTWFDLYLQEFGVSPLNPNGELLHFSETDFYLFLYFVLFLFVFYIWLLLHFHPYVWYLDIVEPKCIKPKIQALENLTDTPKLVTRLLLCKFFGIAFVSRNLVCCSLFLIPYICKPINKVVCRSLANISSKVIISVRKLQADIRLHYVTEAN